MPKRHYTREFKIEAVRLAESIGGNPAAKRLGVPESSLGNWIRLSRLGTLQGEGAASLPTRRAPTELEAGVCQHRCHRDGFKQPPAMTRIRALRQT
ncbi:MAG: transposase [Acidiferrobacter sp.]